MLFASIVAVLRIPCSTTFLNVANREFAFMWDSFALSVAVLLVGMYVPGYLLLEPFGVRKLERLICAPAVSIAVLSLLAIAYTWLGVFQTGALLLASLLCIALVVFAGTLAVRKAKGRLDETKGARGGGRLNLPVRLGTDARILLLYLGVALVIGIRFFIIPLDGADSFVQDSDNSWHLSLIRSFVDSGNMSTLDTNLFHDLDGRELTIMPTNGSFYPAAWHELAAILTSLFGVPVSLAANALNFVLLVFVFPPAAFLFLREVFDGDTRKVAFGSAVSLAFVSFPWGMLIPASGPLYPLLLGMCFVPLMGALVVGVVRAKGTLEKMKRIVLMCVVAVVMALGHPSALFTAVLIMAPYCTYAVFKAVKIRVDSSGIPHGGAIAVASGFAFALAVLLLWAIAFKLPFLQSTVTFNWASYASPGEEIVNILTLELKRPASQICLSILVFLGVVRALRDRRFAWMVVSYVLSCVFLFVSATSEGFLKSFLTGFWYTDTYRLAANVAFVGIPLATLGLWWSTNLVCKAASLWIQKVSERRIQRIAAAVVSIVFVVVNYYSDFSADTAEGDTVAFGDVEASLTSGNYKTRNNLYDAAEIEFAKAVAESVDPDDLIYNNADDGSPFSYAFEGLNLCYRRSAAELLKSESEPSELLRLHLSEFASDSEVQDVVEEAGIKYVLILDLGGEPLDERCYYGYYTMDKWSGMNPIDDDTPGFRVVLSEGDMRLYEIDWSVVQGRTG